MLLVPLLLEDAEAAAKPSAAQRSKAELSATLCSRQAQARAAAGCAGQLGRTARTALRPCCKGVAGQATRRRVGPRAGCSTDGRSGSSGLAPARTPIHTRSASTRPAAGGALRPALLIQHHGAPARPSPQLPGLSSARPRSHPATQPPTQQLHEFLAGKGGQGRSGRSAPRAAALPHLRQPHRGVGRDRVECGAAAAAEPAQPRRRRGSSRGSQLLLPRQELPLVQQALQLQAEAGWAGRQQWAGAGERLGWAHLLSSHERKTHEQDARTRPQPQRTSGTRGSGEGGSGRAAGGRPYNRL